MPVKDVVIRAQELGGRWTAIGSDSARGIIVEDLSCDADTWGSRSASFTLRRNGRVPWPDIGAFAPLEIESQGLPIWSGRVKGTPTTDGSDRRITVNGEGWQYHLDDDVYLKNYVQTDLGAWKDQRSYAEAQLAFCIQNGNVVLDGTGVTFGYPAATYPAGATVGVTLDFGPTLCKTITINWQSSNNAVISCTCQAGMTPDALGTTVAGWSFANNTNPAGRSDRAVFATPQRYVHFIMFFAVGGALAADVWVRFYLARLFADTAYESGGGASILKASDLVLDAKSKATLLLSSSVSKVQATTFNIPDFVMSKPSTPRDVINAANAYHNYQARVGVDKAIEYRPLPANAAIQVDQRSEFDEASAGDSSEIYSSAIVSYTDAGNVAQTVPRGQTSTLYAPSLIQPSNPGAEVNTTNWTQDSGTLSRTTTAGEFSAGVAGFKVAVAASFLGQAHTSAWTATFIPGTSYRLLFDIRGDSAPAVSWSVTISVDSIVVASVAGVGTGAFVTGQAVDWVQTSASAPVVTINGQGFPAPFNFYFDNLVLYESAATVVNRRGFRRSYLLDTNMSLTQPAAQQIGDTFLAAHKVQPFKGKLVVTGHGTARKTPSGVSMPTAELLLNAGELVRFAHLIDPDTGAIGREGRVASVSWDAPSDTATIEIDSQSQNFEAFIARLGILTGQVK